MKLELRRVILFTPRLEAMVAFYREVIGLAELGREPGWVDFDAGACRLALHDGRAKVGARPPKLAFFAADVAAARAMLVKRGCDSLGPILSAGSFDMCNGKDPDGNAFQISSRK